MKSPRKDPVSNSKLAVWDFTLSNKHCDQPDDLIKILQKLAKTWCFQREEGESGYRHFQGRMSLIKREYHGAFIKFLNARPPVLDKMDVRPTSNECLRGKNFYCLKEQTKIEGPWKDTDREIFVPIQFRVKEWYPWQQSLIDICDQETSNSRQVHVVHDPKGSSGKSTLAGYLHGSGKAFMIPPVNNCEDLLGVVMGIMEKLDKDETYTFLIDIPRGIRNHTLHSFYAGLESVKNGFIYDKRYKYRSLLFNSPTVIVYCNAMPPLTVFTRDRWRIWEIEDRQLVDRTSKYFETPSQPLKRKTVLARLAQ